MTQQLALRDLIPIRLVIPAKAGIQNRGTL